MTGDVYDMLKLLASKGQIEEMKMEEKKHPESQINAQFGSPAGPSKKAPGERETFANRLNELTRKPRRHPAIHWAALILSFLSLVPLIFWLISSSSSLAQSWYGIDIWFSVFFAFEFVTRSGFRWNPAGYTRSRFFDFIAIVPALVLVHLNVPYETTWVWIILSARIIRAFDRVLGDGFITRNVFAIAEGFEEEITDRVTLRILDRIEEDMNHGSFTKAIGTVFETNKERVLQAIQAQHPHILETKLAQVAGIEKALDRAEGQAYDAVVNILKSPELDKTIRESVESAFSTMRKGIAEKSWKNKIGFRRQTPDPFKAKK
jgi:hypothetical protein